MVSKQKAATTDQSLPDTETLIEMMGGTEHILAEMAEYANRQRRMDDMLVNLTEQYPNQWAALTESGELLIAPSLETLSAKFRELETRPGSNVIEFLNTDPIPWIL